MRRRLLSGAQELPVLVRLQYRSRPPPRLVGPPTTLCKTHTKPARGIACSASKKMKSPSAGWRLATLAWIEGLVIGRNLCPWAAATVKTSEFRLVHAPSLDVLEDIVVAEAAAFPQQCPSSTPPPTILVVCDTDCPVADFAKISNRATRRVSELQLDVLAFHPDRIDTGPGCSTDPSDAAHYTVKSPLPTIQLLRQSDLRSARADYASRHDSTLPGALELLNGNKQRLRTVGPARLRSQLESWRAQWRRPEPEPKPEAAA